MEMQPSQTGNNPEMRRGVFRNTQWAQEIRDTDIGLVPEILSAKRPEHSALLVAYLRLNNNTEAVVELESCFLGEGDAESVIHRVYPKTFSTMVMQTDRITFGIAGTMEFSVEGSRRSPIIMWDIPRFSSIRGKRLALGICERGQNSAASFKDMCYNKTQAYFKRKDFAQNAKRVKYVDPGRRSAFTLDGTMEGEKEINIIVDINEMK